MQASFATGCVVGSYILPLSLHDLLAIYVDCPGITH